jgi:hypothetical protein
MGFVIPMMMALMLAVAMATVIGLAVLRESGLVAVFYEDHHDTVRR